MAVGVGDQMVFFRYAVPPPDNDHIFSPGDLLVVAALDGDDAFRCFPLDADGRVTSSYGDVLFPDEVVPLTYAPKLKLEPGLVRCPLVLPAEEDRSRGWGR